MYNMHSSIILIKLAHTLYDILCVLGLVCVVTKSNNKKLKLINSPNLIFTKLLWVFISSSLHKNIWKLIESLFMQY